jgi:hypothetical protein
MFGYSLNHLIDLANAIIVDVEATPTRISKEVDATETMIERTVERFALAPHYMAAASSSDLPSAIFAASRLSARVRPYKCGNHTSRRCRLLRRDR